MSAIEKLALKMHATRCEVERLRREMAACQCQFEQAADWAQFIRIDRDLADIKDDDARPDADEEERKPCWKGYYLTDHEGNAHFRSYGASRPGGGWCPECKRRQEMYAPFVDAKRSLAALKGAFWRAAKRLAEAQS
jgi:hypothetical protein